MKNLLNSHFIGLWKSQSMIPHWTYDDDVEIIIYSYSNFSIRVDGNDSLLAEGQLQVNSLEDDAFELLIDGYAIDQEHLRYLGRMYMIDGEIPPSFVLTVPGYGERFFIRIRE